MRTSAISGGLGEGLPNGYDAPLRRGFDWHPRGSDFTVGAAIGASTLGLYEPPRCPCEVWDQSGSYLHGAARVGAITRDGDLMVWPRLGVAWSYFELRDGDRQVHGHQTELTAEERRRLFRLDIDANAITWNRVLDINDRMLRSIEIGRSRDRGGHRQELRRCTTMS